MPFLINGPENKETLIKCLTKAARETTKPESKRAFYGLTCYFDLEAIKMLAKRIEKSVRQAQGNLIGFHIAVDAGEWIKSRIAIKEVIDEISRLAELPTESITFTPVNMTNQLFHAKAYGLLSPLYPKTGCRKGFIAVTSGNLTLRGLGIDDHCNVELVEILKEPSALAEFIDIMHRISNEFAAPMAIQDEFLLALRIFSAGCFYHKWEGNLSNNVLFRITLTETGKKARESDQKLFPGYSPDSMTISRDPLNLDANLN